ncbi:hypothetical protein [Neptuniibacter sp. QD37_11]|uniref:hypothetical protein n=1 Tax=Neptuniibacter sp. QD37_11 TaxID=3398209 RepID=UPI0039F5D579
MFDANMRHSPEGTAFFAKVLSTNDALKSHGIDEGDFIQCVKLASEPDQARARVELKSGDIEVSHVDSLDSYWLVYEGMADGSDFISPDSKKICMDMLA